MKKEKFGALMISEKIQNKIWKHYKDGLKLHGVCGSSSMGALFKNDNEFNRVINYVRRAMAGDENKKGIELSKKDVEQVIND